MRIKGVILTILSLCLLACTPELNTMDGKMIEVNGTITLVGNSPFTHLAISGPENKNLLLIPKTTDQRISLVKAMGTTQTLQGRLTIKESKSADGKITITDYFLYLETTETDPLFNTSVR
jgi:hypothetical protein